MELHKDKVLVIPVKAATESKGGILLPEGATDINRTTSGKVVAVGSEAEEELTIKGDIVVFQKFTGIEIKINDTDYLLLDVSQIYMVLGENEELG